MLDAAIVAAWILAALLAGGIVRLLWNRVLVPLARKTRTHLDVFMLRSTRVAVEMTALVAVLNLAARVGLRGHPALTTHAAWPVVLNVLHAALVLALTLVGYGIVRAALDWHHERTLAEDRAKTSHRFLDLTRRLAKYVFLFVAVAVVLRHIGIEITGLLATAGVASVAVAFAAQETLSNMIAGFILMIDRPFQPGDRVTLANGQTGDVIEIGLRSTRILSFDNTVITIPNAEIAKNQITNLNAPDAHYKIRATIGVAYGSDLRKVKRILLEILRGHAEVLKEPAPGVYFTEFGESSLNLMFVGWVADYREQFRIRDEINMAIKDRFEAEGVEIPFPQRDVHIRTPSSAAPAPPRG